MTSLSTCHFLLAVILGGENLNPLNQRRPFRPSLLCRRRDRESRSRACGLITAAAAFRSLDACADLGGAGAGAPRTELTAPDTHTRTLPAADHTGTKRQVLLRFSSPRVTMPGRGITNPAGVNQRELQKRGKTHHLSARPWSVGSRGSARFLAGSACICASVRSRAHACACALPCSVL